MTTPQPAPTANEFSAAVSVSCMATHVFPPLWPDDEELLAMIN